MVEDSCDDTIFRETSEEIDYRVRLNQLATIYCRPFDCRRASTIIICDGSL